LFAIVAFLDALRTGNSPCPLPFTITITITATTILPALMILCR